MTRAILHLIGRILVNIHMIVLLALAVGADWVSERTVYPDWQLGLVALSVFLLLVFLRRAVLSRYVTGKWNTHDLKRFYSEDRANRYYEPWEQKRLFRE